MMVYNNNTFCGRYTMLKNYSRQWGDKEAMLIATEGSPILFVADHFLLELFWTYIIMVGSTYGLKMGSLQYKYPTSLTGFILFSVTIHKS